jgi:hypothetical protein
MSEPATEFLRWSQVVNWLEEIGITRTQSRALMEEQIIKGAPLPGKKNGRDYYRKSQIKEALQLK